MEDIYFKDIEKFIRTLKILDYSEEDIRMILSMKKINITNIKNIIKYFDFI